MKGVHAGLFEGLKADTVSLHLVNCDVWTVGQLICHSCALGILWYMVMLLP